MKTWMSGMIFILPLRDKGRRKCSGYYAGSNSLCGFFLGFLLHCQHMLYIRMYVIQFISLYFVPLSGLLITSNLSLKCNYGHHVMFQMKCIWYRRLGETPRLGKGSINGKQKHALKTDGGVSYFFHHNKEEKNFDICIKQKSAYNRPYTVTMHHKCC